jgi:hypothetical protein
MKGGKEVEKVIQCRDDQCFNPWRDGFVLQRRTQEDEDCVLALGWKPDFDADLSGTGQTFYEAESQY